MPLPAKDVPAMHLLSTAKKLAGIQEIPPFAQQSMPLLYGKAGALGLEIVGPEVFTYHFLAEGGMELRIGIPVREAKGDALPFEFFSTNPVKCVSRIHQGSMKTIGVSWDALHQEAKDSKLEFTNECREVYLVWKDFDSAENMTELQRILK